jgi:NAD(P)-dependent dehydrogenase (short-subunit alcohol dehydrogenase family)
MKLEGKVAVVTGGAQGIGRAIALGLGRAGAKIVIADLQADKAGSVANELNDLGTEALPMEVDVANESAVKRLADQTFNRFGRIDILVNDAGVYLKALVVDIAEENWDRTMNVNLGSNFLCARAFVPAILSR